MEADKLRIQAKAGSRTGNRIQEENDFNLLMRDPDEHVDETS